MDFSFSDEQVLLCDTMRLFVEREITPVASRMDEERSISRELISKMAEMGLFGIYIPVEFGGGGLDVLSYVLALEQIAGGSASVGVMISVNNSLVSDPILKFGTQHQKKEFLTPLARGEKIGCFGLTESGSGSDAFALRTSARKANGGYILNGTKIFISNGAISNLAIIFATHDPSRGYRGISAFIVEKERAGFSVGKKEDKMGLLASDTAELILEDCFLPEENLLGKEGEGYKVAMSAINGGRIGIAAESVGIAQAALDASVRYAAERKQFGSSIGEFQGVGFMLADMAVEVEAARMLACKAAWLKDAQLPFMQEASMAKLYASEMVNRVTYKGIQIYGGYGYMKDYPLERYYRDARVNTLYEGTSEIQRLLISKELLKQEKGK